MSNAEENPKEQNPKTSLGTPLQTGFYLRSSKTVTFAYEPSFVRISDFGFRICGTPRRPARRANTLPPSA